MRRSIPFVVLAAACGATTPADKPALVVTAPTIYRHAGGDTPVAGDTFRLFVEAQVDDGTGHVRRVAGEPDGHGALRLEGIQGATWVRAFDAANARERWVWTDAPALDLGEDVAGRADGLRATVRPTNLVLDATGLDTWQDGDQLEWGTNAGFAIYASNVYFSKHDPQPGVTGLDGLSLDFAGRPLLDAAKGDKAYLTQIRNFTDAAHGVSWSAPVSAAVVEGVTQPDGKETHAQVTFQAPPEGSYRLHWKRSAFQALRTAIHPKRVEEAANQRTFLHAIPGGTAHGRLSPLELRVFDGLFPAEGTEDLDLTLPLRNPFPANWLAAFYEFDFIVDYASPEGPAGGGAGLDCGIGVVTTTLPDDGVAPAISPVRAPTLAGRDFFANVDHVGTTPTLAWQAPEIGTPTSYEIVVFEPTSERQGGPRPGVHMRFDDIATLFVPGDKTSIALPDGLLQTGHTYAMRIRAVQEPGQDIRRAPFRHALPSAWADLATDYVTP